MFDNKQQFYPTPKPLVTQMWQMLHEIIDGPIGTILDPSAGKGDLLEEPSCYRRSYHSQSTGYAIEIDPDLQAILREKGHTVLGGDFLAYSEPLEFRAILMNPPFNQGVHHVLKAWSILKPGGGLVAIVNSETIENQCHAERQRLGELIDLFGGSKKLGQAFKDAQRPVLVSVSMIWLAKPRKEMNPNEFKFTGNFRQASDETFNDFAANPLASSDAIDALVAQYHACLNAMKAKREANEELQYHLKSLGKLAGDKHRTKDKLTEVPDWFSEVANLKYRFWWAVFKMSRMSEISTSDFREKFNQFVSGQVQMAFDRDNILQALAIFFQNKEQIKLDSIVDVFDKLTKYSEKNVTHTEGWKTNSGWRINSKVIVPWGCGWSSIWNDWELSWGSDFRNFLDDLDEVLCWIADEEYREEDRTAAIIDRSKRSEKRILPGQWVEARFYEFKLFKKGTVHIRFTDQYLLDDFNHLAAKGKNWLGGEGF